MGLCKVCRRVPNYYLGGGYCYAYKAPLQTLLKKLSKLIYLHEAALGQPSMYLYTISGGGARAVYL